MANPSKNKGDAAEREAVCILQELAPDLLVPDPMRMLGAGRKDDVGDLRVFDDVAVQVRAYKAANLGSAIRTSAVDSVAQAANGRMSWGLGMVPVPRARTGTVRWLACATTDGWPGQLGTGDFDAPLPVQFGTVSKLVTWLRDDEAPHGYVAYPRADRVGVLVTGSATPVLVAPIEAWLQAYRLAARVPNL